MKKKKFTTKDIKHLGVLVFLGKNKDCYQVDLAPKLEGYVLDLISQL